jgi:DNA-directed RNA polymerase specialized sigma24 family protein
VTIALDDTLLPTTRRRVSPVEPFESLLERHGPAVLRFCVARLGRDRGEEAFQETLLAALRHYDDLRDGGAAGPWLFSIAQRKIIDSARSLARAPLATDQLDEPYRDIAEAMGTTADAARRNVFEGLNRLRRDLADDRCNL